MTVWQLGQRRSQRKEQERRAELRSRGFGGGKEKGLGWGKFVRAWRFALWRGGVNWCLGAEGSL